MSRGTGGRPLRCYLSHHKCATMYAISILGRVSAELDMVQRVLYGPEEFGGDLDAFVARNPTDILSYIDAEWEYVENLSGYRSVHVIRDPRDILVSAYFSHLHSHDTSAWPELVEHRETLRQVPKEEGLYLEMEFTGYVFDSMRNWDYDRENILELRFEQLANHPYEFWLDAARHLDLVDERDFGLRRNLVYALQGIVNQAHRTYGWWPLSLPRERVPGQRLLGIAYDNRYSKKAGGREQGESDPESHYRKGKSGDWRNHLTEEHLQEFRSRFPGLLTRTGYADENENRGSRTARASVEG